MGFFDEERCGNGVELEHESVVLSDVQSEGCFDLTPIVREVEDYAFTFRVHMG